MPGSSPAKVKVLNIPQVGIVCKDVQNTVAAFWNILGIGLLVLGILLVLTAIALFFITEIIVVIISGVLGLILTIVGFIMKSKGNKKE